MLRSSTLYIIRTIIVVPSGRWIDTAKSHPRRSLHSAGILCVCLRVFARVCVCMCRDYPSSWLGFPVLTHDLTRAGNGCPSDVTSEYIFVYGARSCMRVRATSELLHRQPRRLPNPPPLSPCLQGKFAPYYGVCTLPFSFSRAPWKSHDCPHPVSAVCSVPIRLCSTIPSTECGIVR